jgi:molecular chaperone GrpE
VVDGENGDSQAEGPSAGGGTVLDEGSPEVAVLEGPETGTGRKVYEEILAAIRQLSQMFDARFAYDQTKERVIDQLHAEVLQHRADLRFDLLRPIFADLVALHDDLAGLADAVARDASLPDRLRQSIPSYVTTIEEILERNGVEPFEDEGREFNGKRQRVARAVPTADPAEHGRIAGRSRKGFAYGERVVRPESVMAFRYTRPPEETGQVEKAEGSGNE